MRLSSVRAGLLCLVSIATGAIGCSEVLGYDDTYRLAKDPPESGGGAAGMPGGAAGSGGLASSGAAGTSGNSGAAGTSGNGGSAGTSGNGGAAGTSGSSGAAGTSGNSGAAGTSGTSGAAGTSGTSGAAGTSGSAGSAGIAGAAGAGGTTGGAGSAGAGGTGAAGGGGSAGSGGDVVHPAIDREYVIACFIPIVAQPDPVLFAGRLKSGENSPTVAMTVQLLRTTATSLKDVVPGATTYATSGSVSATGDFAIGFPDNVTILDAGNPFTAADSEFASPFFEGSVANLERVCATVTGAFVAPAFPVPGAPCVFEAVGPSGTFVPPGNADCRACPPPTAVSSGTSKGPPACVSTSFDCSACPRVTSGRLTAFASDTATWCDARSYCAAIGKRFAAPNARELLALGNALDLSGSFPTPELLVGFQQPAGYKTPSTPWCTATDNPVEVISFPPTYYVLDDRGLDGNENGEADCGSLRAGGADGLQAKDVDCSKPLKGFLCEDIPPGG